MIITPEQLESQYLEVPPGWNHSSDVSWTVRDREVPPCFKVWIPQNRIKEISLLVSNAGNQYGTICLQYGSLPRPWDDEKGPFERHGSVGLDDLNSHVFQFGGSGQVVHQIFDPPFPGGGTWLYGAIASYQVVMLQVVLRLADVVVPPAPVVKQQRVTVKGTTQTILALPPGVKLKYKKTTPQGIVYRVIR